MSFEAPLASAPRVSAAGVVTLTLFALLLLTGVRARRAAIAEGHG